MQKIVRHTSIIKIVNRPYSVLRSYADLSSTTSLKTPTTSLTLVEPTTVEIRDVTAGPGEHNVTVTDSQLQRKDCKGPF